MAGVMLTGCCRGFAQPLYRPGRDMIVVYEGKLELAGADAGLDKLTIDRVELPVTVTPSLLPGRVDIEMTIRHFRWERETDGRRHVFDSSEPLAKQREHRDYLLHYLQVMPSIRFVGQMDRQGRAVRFDGRGQPFDEIDQLVKPGVPRWARWRLLLMKGWTSAVYRRAIGTSTAYLPTPAMGMGSRWRVDRVLPNGATGGPGRWPPFFIQEYVTYMLLRTSKFREQALCQLDRVEATPRGRVAVIALRARRDGVPDGLTDEPMERERWMEGEGTLRYNLSTAAIERLRIKWTFHLEFEDASPEIGTLTETLSVKPAR